MRQAVISCHIYIAFEYMFKLYSKLLFPSAIPVTYRIREQSENHLIHIPLMWRLTSQV